MVNICCPRILEALMYGACSVCFFCVRVSWLSWPGHASGMQGRAVPFLGRGCGAEAASSRHGTDPLPEQEGALQGAGNAGDRNDELR